MRMRVRDPGIFLTLDPGSGMEQFSNPQSGINIPDRLSRIRKTAHKLFLILNLRFFKEK